MYMHFTYLVENYIIFLDFLKMIKNNILARSNYLKLIINTGFTIIINRNIINIFLILKFYTVKHRYHNSMGLVKNLYDIRVFEISRVNYLVYCISFWDLQITSKHRLYSIYWYSRYQSSTCIWLNETAFCVTDTFFSKYDENDGSERRKITKCTGWMSTYIKHNT